MTKTNAIEDQDTLDYKASLAAFMATVNPKPTLEQVEKLRRMYLEKRGVR